MTDLATIRSDMRKILEADDSSDPSTGGWSLMWHEDDDGVGGYIVRLDDGDGLIAFMNPIRFIELRKRMGTVDEDVKALMEILGYSEGP